MPRSTAAWIVATLSLSSWEPQPQRQGPPIAQAPRPTLVISGPRSPSFTFRLSALIAPPRSSDPGPGSSGRRPEWRRHQRPTGRVEQAFELGVDVGDGE